MLAFNVLLCAYSASRGHDVFGSQFFSVENINEYEKRFAGFDDGLSVHRRSRRVKPRRIADPGGAYRRRNPAAVGDGGAQH